MFWFVVIILLAVGAAFVPKEIKSSGSYGSEGWTFKTLKVKIPVWVLLALFLALTFIVNVKPGQVVRVYHIVGGESTLTVGYNVRAPWDKMVIWDATARAYVFMEKGDDNDPNDAFGGQTANGDYMTTVANASVRIDTGRMAEYISIFGEKNLDDNIGIVLKGILKDSFERCLEKRPTEEVMANKSVIVNEARSIAIKRVQEQLPLVMVELTYPDIAASPEYEAAIKAIADARMQAQLAKEQEEKNKTEAAANLAAAEGRKNVTKTDADADKYKKETAAEAEANALRTKATAEAEASGKLGALFAQYPGLLEVKRLDALQAVLGKDSNWDGRVVPYIDSSGSVSVMNIDEFLKTLIPQN